MHGIGALVLLAAAGCADEREDLVRKTIGPAGGLVSSHDHVLTLVFQPGALTHDHEIEIFPSDEPPLVFGPAYRVRPDIALEVDVEVTYRRVLPSDTDGVSVAAIRLDDYAAEEGHWSALPRLSIDVASGAVLASDSELSLYYGMLEAGGGGSTTPGTADSGGTSQGPGGATDTATVGDETTDATTAAPTTGPTTSTTDPTGEGCGNGSVDPGEVCLAATDFAMGGGPVGVAVGDFDDDGDLDVATANADGSYSVRLGNGQGSLGTEQGDTVGTGPTAIGAGDLDGAMGDDLAITVAGTGTLALLQSQGDGTFALMPLSLTDPDPAEVLLVDLTDDGGPDVVIASRGGGSVTYYSFAGGLGPEVIYSAGMVAEPAGLAYGQFDLGNNMFEDVFVFGGGSYAALPGDGFGLADAPVGGSLGTDLRGAVGGNLGGATAGDVAVADHAEGGVYVLLGNGAANGFAAMDFHATGAGAIDVAAGDVTGDGEIDLVVANQDDATVTVLEKTGASSWGNATDFAVGAGPSGVAVGDLNEDGIADIIVSCETGDVITVSVSDP